MSRRAAKAKDEPLEPGDRVWILDTANDRRRVGYIRTMGEDGSISVYVKRFDSIMKFEGGKTGLGRFRLVK